MKKLKNIDLAKLTPPIIRNINQDKFPTKVKLSGDLVFPKGVNTIAIFGAVDYVAVAIQDYLYANKLNKNTSDSEVTLVTGQEIHFHTSLLKLSDYTKDQIYLVEYSTEQKGTKLTLNFLARSTLAYNGVEELSNDQVYSKIKSFRYYWTPVTITEVVDMYVKGVKAASGLTEYRRE